jgi:hypothetical protein
MPRNIFARRRPPTLTVALADPERVALMDLIEHEFRANGRGLPLPAREALQAAYGRLANGDQLTLAESVAAFGPRWYVSPTGRALKSREPDETPITPRRYEEAQTAAIRARGERLFAACTGRTVRKIKVYAGNPTPEPPA